MNRRGFLKLALLTSGLTVAGYAGYDLLQMTNASVQSIGSQIQTSSGEQISSDWQIPHLLRRAGFGASPSDLDDFRNLGVSGSLDQLINYENTYDPNLSDTPDITMTFTLKPARSDMSALIWWWINRMVMTSRPLEEKMTLFWHNHFATAIYKVRSPFLMFQQNQLLRSRAMGKFEELLMGITEDPAMLLWLDGATNRKGVANENYGREVMEVFTIGRGNYTEDDVKAAARAFTGYTLNKDGNAVFKPRLHDDGSKTFLGQTGNFDPQDIVHILANHPATARNLSTQLFQFFAFDNPTSDIIDRLSNIYMGSGGDIKAVVREILTSPEFMSQQAYLSGVKSPVEYVVSALRSLDAAVTPNVAIRTLNNMGQLPFDPPSVFGWPSGIAWINTSTMLERYNFPLYLRNAFGTALVSQDSGSVDDVGQALFPDGLPEEVVSVIENANSSLVDSMDKLRNSVRLTMATPFYNLN